MNPYRSLASSIAKDAGALLRARFDATRTIEFKGAGRSDLVTDADRASEALILERLSREVPQHAVVAEESGASARASAFTWLVDPLDGTTNYAHGVPHFSVTLALLGPRADGSTGLLVGVVFDPLRDELFSAAHGEGATVNGRALKVTSVDRLELGLLATGFPYDLHQRPDRPLALFRQAALRAQGMRRLGSAALDLAYVAAGRFDGFFEVGLKPWDTAAGALLVEEAGGVVRRIDGAPYDVWTGELWASGTSLAGELGAALR